MMETKQQPAAKKPDAVKKLQDIAAAEAKRKREESQKKKPTGVSTSPSQGVIGRMYDYFTGGSKEKK